MCKNYTRAVGRQHFKKYKVMVIFTWFYNVKLKPHVQTTPIVHSFGYIFIKLIIEIKKKKVAWEAKSFVNIVSPTAVCIFHSSFSTSVKLRIANHT